MDGPGITIGCGALCWGDDGHASAFAFTPGETSTFLTLETVAWARFQAANMFISIWTDDNGLPGTVIESFSIALGVTPTPVTLNSVEMPSLMKDTQYWFVAEAGDPINDFIQLGINTIGAEGYTSTRIGDEPWQESYVNMNAVFRVTGDVSAVPEPSTVGMIAAALVGLVFVRVRKMNN